jgi:predicted N-acetyltransferase YhbS
MEGRLLDRREIGAVWSIDRSEIVRSAYRLRDGELVRYAVHFDVRGSPPGEEAKYTPLLEAAFDRGGWLYGLFDGSAIQGVAVVDNRRVGTGRDLLQLAFLHVSRGARGRGQGRALFELARSEAARLGASGLYVSATPSVHTIDFYLRLGCTLVREPDPALLALEPDDIHLECRRAPRPGAPP